MRLTTKGRYGIRLMVALLRHYGEGPVSARQISEKEKISMDYIEQLFIKLKKGRLIKVVRGPKGGFLLAKPPSKIKVGDIMNCVGESVELAPCIEIKSKRDRCVLDDRCVTRIFFRRMTNKLKGMIDSTSLADLLKESRRDQG